jgi:hypothetical protein
VPCDIFATFNTLWTFSVHRLITKTVRQEIKSDILPPFFLIRRTAAFFCRTAGADVTDRFTTSRLFYRPGIHIFTRSEFKLHTVLASPVSGDPDNMRPQRCLIISAPVQEKPPTATIFTSFITAYHLQLLLLTLPNL